MLILRDYQQASVNGVRGAYRSGFTAPLLVLPTGGGKTVVFCHIAATTTARGKTALILVHRIELLNQTSKALGIAGVDHGLINPKYTPNLMAPVQVASVQTLVKRLHKYALNPNLIVIDEAHHATAGTWRKIIDHFPKTLILGVTATPIRTDGAGLGVEAGGIFDTLVIGPQVTELIDKGFLVRPIVYAPLEKLDLSNVRVQMGDYNKGELSKEVNKPKITGNAVAHYTKLCPGDPCVVFCVSVQHAEDVAAEFRAAGYNFYSVDGAMDDDRREMILTGLGNGTVQGVCSCDLISEGTDIPAIACAILLRPTKSTGLYLQQVGRALRPSDGKDRAIILDHVGNVLTHGLPDDLREWSLEGIKKRRGKQERENIIKTKQCEKCYAVHPPGPICPVCGHIYINDEPPEEVSGELTEVDEEAARQIKLNKIREQGAAKTLDELEKIAMSRGYKKGWAKHIYNSRQKKVNK